MKTVYVLGAGFSYGAGFPLQEQLLERLRGLGIVDIPPGPFDVFVDAAKKALPFIGEAFQGENPGLEDVFTVLDQAIAKREHCAGADWGELDAIRESLKTCILIALHAAHQQITASALEFYRSFAAHLMFEAFASVPSEICVISLNWDAVLEDSIYWCIRQLKLAGRADINYGCDSRPLAPECPHIPSFEQGSQFLGFRVFKPHGSVNWLVCPACGRLFTGLGSPEEAWAQYCLPRPCPACAALTRALRPPVLRPLYVTPTFLKSFENLHLQNVWYRAYLDLAEADSIIFVGYSFPNADYHLRTLFRRAVRSDARVTCVLIPTDVPSSTTPRSVRSMFAVSRYKAFFGAGRVTVSTAGTQGYFGASMAGRSQARLVDRLRRRARRHLAGASASP